jgi:hypothetical protein
MSERWNKRRRLNKETIILYTSCFCFAILIICTEMNNIENLPFVFTQENSFLRTPNNQLRDGKELLTQRYVILSFVSIKSPNCHQTCLYKRTHTVKMPQVLLSTCRLIYYIGIYFICTLSHNWVTWTQFIYPYSCMYEIMNWYRIGNVYVTIALGFIYLINNLLIAEIKTHIHISQNEEMILHITSRISTPPFTNLWN